MARDKAHGALYRGTCVDDFRRAKQFASLLSVPRRVRACHSSDMATQQTHGIRRSFRTPPPPASAPYTLPNLCPSIPAPPSGPSATSGRAGATWGTPRPHQLLSTHVGATPAHHQQHGPALFAGALVPIGHTGEPSCSRNSCRATPMARASKHAHAEGSRHLTTPTPIPTQKQFTCQYRGTRGVLP